MSSDHTPIKKIAIVGTGISGLTAAYLLNKKYDITVFEKNDYIGGHTRTIEVETASGNYAVDTGFIVFNDRTYPNFITLMDKLGVKKQKTNMSFSYSSAQQALEYSGDTLNTLFSQRKNLLSPKFYRLLFDIYQFNKKSKRFLLAPYKTTLDEYIAQDRYGTLFKKAYLHPLASAIWSSPLQAVGDMPAEFILRFYLNHGLLDITNRPQWYTIKGGSHSYIAPLVKSFKDKIHLNCPVEKISRGDKGVQVTANNNTIEFDAVVLTCHSDQALKMLSDPSKLETKILGSIPYYNNQVILHTDIKALPKSKTAWASWNYIDTDQDTASLTYYMNKLQNIKAPVEFCVSVNNNSIDPEKIIKNFSYAHPSYENNSVNAKSSHAHINGKRNTFYAGAYWGNGFHEDGVLSSIIALKKLGVTL